MIAFYRNGFKWSMTMLVLVLFACTHASGQIYQPEGLNMPGDWNSWGNPPAENSPLGNEFQVNGGGIKKLTNGTTRWQTTFTGLSGGQFLFTSGPNGSPYNNNWN